jgi:hypothetical protein
MPVQLDDLVTLLGQQGLRHHVDVDQGVIRVVFTTETYHNLRGERLAIVTLSTPDEGRILRGTIERAFEPRDDVPRACALLCEMAAATPLVGVEYDRDCDNLRIVAECGVEDSRPTARQIVSLVGRLVDAAEVWFAARLLADSRPAGSACRRPGREQDAA